MRIIAQPLTAEAFAPYGDVLAPPTEPGRVYFEKGLKNGRAGARPSLAVTHARPLAALPLRNVAEVRPDEPGQGPLWHIPAAARPIFLKLLAPNALIGLGAGLIIPFLNIFVEGKFGVDFSTLGAVFAWSQLGMALAVMTQPLIADRLGKVASIMVKRDWNDEAAKKQLLKFFEAFGPMDPATVAGRRKLSAAWFS